MSRGYGQVQRRLLEILKSDSREIDTFELASRVYESQPDSEGVRRLSEPQVVAVRRALRGLVAKGEVRDLGRRYRNNREHWAINAGI